MAIENPNTPIAPEHVESDYAPKPMTPAQTAVMTVKILAIAGVLMLMLWLMVRAKG